MLRFDSSINYYVAYIQILSGNLSKAIFTQNIVQMIDFNPSSATKISFQRNCTVGETERTLKILLFNACNVADVRLRTSGTELCLMYSVKSMWYLPVGTRENW